MDEQEKKEYTTDVIAYDYIIKENRTSLCWPICN